MMLSSGTICSDMLSLKTPSNRRLICNELNDPNSPWREREIHWKMTLNMRGDVKNEAHKKSRGKLGRGSLQTFMPKEPN